MSHELRGWLRDDVPIALSRGDINTGNILVFSHRPPQFLATVDWDQADWYLTKDLRAFLAGEFGD